MCPRFDSWWYHFFMRLNLRNRIQSFFYALFKKSLNFRMWFKHALKAQKLQKQHALKVSYQNKAPSLFLNPYCQRILVKVYAVMLDKQRERASGSQLVR